LQSSRAVSATYSACAISRAGVTPLVSIPELRPYVFCFMSFFLQLARKRTRSGPWSPLASACLEHSIDSGLWTTGAGFAFGAGFAAAGGPAAGGVAGGGVCPNAALAHALKTSAIINFFISAPFVIAGCYVLCASACALATPRNARPWMCESEW
jgi:hypothetical protein